MHAIRCSFVVFAAALGLVALSSMAVVAQQDPDEQQAGDEVDPPTRAARLSYIEGAVSVQPAGVDEWTAAAVNRPLTTGDQLWSDRGSRAEIDLGTATVSVADSSSISLLNLSDDGVQLQVTAGTANVTLRDLDPAVPFEIDAPNASVSLERPGSYRIGVDDAGNTVVAMRDGQAQVITGTGQSVVLRGGQGAQFSASGDVDVAPLGAADDFDRWCAQRAQRWTRNQDTSQYVSSDVVGSEELDNNGEWRQEPDYGYVWYPTQVAVDWAPYRYGRWLWVSPWGWTWVDSAPWGYAPFHYGRWAYLRQRWCWVPAPPRSRAVYAPALVAWIGGPRGGVSVAVGAGPGVGWLPLAPGEVYLPGYRVSRRYLHNVNVSNTTIINNTYITNVYRNPQLQRRYANRDVPRGLTVVSQSNFASGQSVAGRTMAPPRQWREVSPTAQPPGIVPVRQSVLGPSAQTPVKRPPIAIANRPVVVRREPPPTPASFDRQTDAMRANGGRALPPAQLQRLRGTDSPRPNFVVAPPTARNVPAAPATPAVPALPGLPGGIPAAPAVRATPNAPATPAGPEARRTPGRPIMPVTPAAPVTPALPGGMPPAPAAPALRAAPERPMTPDRHVMPITPVAPSPPPAAAPAPPIDRRMIPERSPQFQAPAQPRAPAPARAPEPFQRPIQVQPPMQPRGQAENPGMAQRVREVPPQVAPPPPTPPPPPRVVAPPPPPPPPPPQAQPQPKARPAPQGRVEGRREPP